AGFIQPNGLSVPGAARRGESHPLTEGEAAGGPSLPDFIKGLVQTALEGVEQRDELFSAAIKMARREIKRRVEVAPLGRKIGRLMPHIDSDSNHGKSQLQSF